MHVSYKYVIQIICENSRYHRIYMHLYVNSTNFQEGQIYMFWIPSLVCLPLRSGSFHLSGSQLPGAFEAASGTTTYSFFQPPVSRCHAWSFGHEHPVDWCAQRRFWSSEHVWTPNWFQIGLRFLDFEGWGRRRRSIVLWTDFFSVEVVQPLHVYPCLKRYPDLQTACLQWSLMI